MAGHRVARKHQVLHNFPVDEVFLDDAFERFWCAGVIPDAFRIYDGDRPLNADAEAIDFAAIDD